MSDDLFLQFGRASYKAIYWAQERDRLSKHLQSKALSSSSAQDVAKQAVSVSPMPSAPAVRPLAAGARQAAPQRRPAFALSQFEVSEISHPHGRYFGIRKQVASDCRVSPAYVSRLIRGDYPSGLKSSLRGRRARALADTVLDAVRSKIRSIDKELGPRPRRRPQVEPLTAAERNEFRRGGKYFGIPTEIGAQGKVNTKAAGNVVRGTTKSVRALLEVRRMMRERDRKLEGRAS